MKQLLLITVMLAMCTAGQAVDVYESELSSNAVCIHLDENEVQQIQNNYSAADRIAYEAAYKLIGLAGVPESITGKIAALAAWDVLHAKYARDFKRYCKNLGEGSNLTLKYYGIDLDKVRDLWSAAEIADHTIPGSELQNMMLDLVNDLANLALRD